jgi:hypothetical protein
MRPRSFQSRQVLVKNLATPDPYRLSLRRGREGPESALSGRCSSAAERQVLPHTCCSLLPNRVAHASSLHKIPDTLFTSRLFKKPDQNGSASEGPMPRPTISRRPSVSTAMAIIAATETMRPRRACEKSRSEPQAARGRSRCADIQFERSGALAQPSALAGAGDLGEDRRGGAIARPGRLHCLREARRLLLPAGLFAFSGHYEYVRGVQAELLAAPGRGVPTRRGGRGAKDRLSAECRARIVRTWRVRRAEP